MLINDMAIMPAPNGMIYVMYGKDPYDSLILTFQ